MHGMHKGNITEAMQYEAIEIGNLRQDEAVRLGKHDGPINTHAPRTSHIMGCVGEIAVRDWLGIDQALTVNTFKTGADLMEDIEVRTRARLSYDLNFRPNDDPAKRYVLVRYDGRRYPNASAIGEVQLEGWAYGYDCMREEFVGDPGGFGKPCWLMPPTELNSMETLVIGG